MLDYYTLNKKQKAKRQMSEQSSYYFLPHVGIEQQPQAPFQWDGNYEQQCNAAEEKCLGFDSGGNVFDTKAMSPGGARLSFHDSADYGSFLKDEKAFESLCKMAAGSPSGKRCQIAPEQAQAAIQSLAQQGAVETFRGGPRMRRRLMMARARAVRGLMAARRAAQQLQLIKTVLMIGFLVWLVYTVKKLK